MRLKTNEYKNKEWYNPIEDSASQLYYDNLQNEFKSLNDFRQETLNMFYKLNIPFSDYTVPKPAKDAPLMGPIDNQSVNFKDIPNLNEAEYDELLSKYDQGLTEEEKLSKLKFIACCMYNLKPEELEQIQEYCTYEHINLYKNRSLLHYHYDKVIDDGIFYDSNINRNFQLYDNKHKQYDFFIYRLLLDIITVNSVLPSDISKFEINGAELKERWKAELDTLTEHIETITFKMRDTFITKEQCQKWTKSISFVSFFNSIMEKTLGLKLKLYKRNIHDADKSIWHLNDVFDPKLIEIKPVIQPIPCEKLDKNYLQDA